MAFDFGVVSPAGCASYGASVCGASGSSVAAKNVKCAGPELSLGECEFEPADDACLSHVSDAVVFCGANGVSPFAGGKLRLGEGGAPALPRVAGRLEMYLGAVQAWVPVCRNGNTSGSAAVACKSMGFTGASGFGPCASSGLCGAEPPQVFELACAGSESSLLQCPMALVAEVVAQLAKFFRQAAGVSQAVLRLKLPKCNSVGLCRANAGCACGCKFSISRLGCNPEALNKNRESHCVKQRVQPEVR